MELHKGCFSFLFYKEFWITLHSIGLQSSGYSTFTHSVHSMFRIRCKNWIENGLPCYRQNSLVIVNLTGSCSNKINEFSEIIKLITMCPTVEWVSILFSIFHQQCWPIPQWWAHSRKSFNNHFSVVASNLKWKRNNFICTIILLIYKQKSFSISAWDAVLLITIYLGGNMAFYSMQVNCKSYVCIFIYSLSSFVSKQSLQFSIYCTQLTAHTLYIVHCDIIMRISNVQCCLNQVFVSKILCPFQ